jgi:hypothetical protein
VAALNVPIVGRRQVEMTDAEVHVMIEIEPVLKKLGLSLYCERCYESGVGAGGITCKNHPTDHTWTIECLCSVRTYRRHRPET